MCEVVRVAVVGAGIVGASVAYHAARAGASVTVVDRALPGSGATGQSFAWIGGPSGRDVPDGSTPVRASAVEDYHRLESELPDLQVRWTGSLTWDEDGRVADGAFGPDERLLDAAQVGHLEPHLRVPPRSPSTRPLTAPSTPSRPSTRWCVVHETTAPWSCRASRSPDCAATAGA